MKEQEVIEKFIRSVKVRTDAELIVHMFLMDAYDRRFKLNDYKK